MGGILDAGEPIQTLMICWRIFPGTLSKLLYWVVWPLAVMEIWMLSLRGNEDGVGGAGTTASGTLALWDTGGVLAGGAGAPGGCNESCAIMARISASNCASRVFASLSASRAIFFQSGMSTFRANKVQDLCLFKDYYRTIFQRFGVPKAFGTPLQRANR